MELVGQDVKKIMEECKVRARAEGLNIHGDTLEYYVTNKNLLELMPKNMIPTLYDYWVDDVDVIRNKWVYDVSPHNPFETVINTRPTLSFYNNDNPDWLNVMIFYHVLAHVDFYQNNIFFENTWLTDFCNEALANKRQINSIRDELGSRRRWVDYVIEFARGVDNLVGYYQELKEVEKNNSRSILGGSSKRITFYFGEFLRLREKETTARFYHEEIDRLNKFEEEKGQENGEDAFFNDPIFKSKYPEFNSTFKKHLEKKKSKSVDILQHLIDHSEFLDKEANRWMKDILAIIRRTSLYFQPQFRTKIANEGWASYWHDKLFMLDPCIKSHQSDYAAINARVTAVPRMGLNPYAIGMRLYWHIEELAEKGKFSHNYHLLKNIEDRRSYDGALERGSGKKKLFEAGRNFNDQLLVNYLSDNDFQDFVDKYKLFTVGQRLNPDTGILEAYIKSKKGNDYRKMLNDHLYHPPDIQLNDDKVKEGELYLDHNYEGRTLVTKYIPAVLNGLSYLSGQIVNLETTEYEIDQDEEFIQLMDPDYEPEYKKLRILYTCQKEGVVEKRVISIDGEGA